MRRGFGGCVVALLIAINAVAAQKQVLSSVYTIDKKYRSMEGPSSVQTIYLGNRVTPELLWITGIRTEMVGADGKSVRPAELMCHVNVDLDTAVHQALFDLPRPAASRLMTLSQGMLSASLPPGYGFPIASSEPLLLFTQVLNLNIEHPGHLQVRHRVTFEYVRDRDLKQPMKALFNVGASGTVQLADNRLALTSMMPGTPASQEHRAASCLIGIRAPQAMAGSADYVDPAGRHMTGHWIVPPGRQVNASDITWFLLLPFDTRLHYAAVHLHPFAESLSVRDVTTGETVFSSKAINPASGIGLTHVDTLTSAAGVPMYRDHKYELISIYNNPTEQNADSMASVFLGLDDHEFVRPTPTDLARRSAALLDSNELAIRTSEGDFTAVLARDAAPATAIQVSRLALAGAFDNAATITTGDEIRISVPVTEALRKLLQPAGGDRGLPAEAGTVAYCAPTAQVNEVTLRVLAADAPVFDARCVAFARLASGEPVVRAIHDAPAGVSAFVKGIDAFRGLGPASR